MRTWRGTDTALNYALARTLMTPPVDELPQPHITTLRSIHSKLKRLWAGKQGDFSSTALMDESVLNQDRAMQAYVRTLTHPYHMTAKLTTA